jgi:hypothetical protein
MKQISILTGRSPLLPEVDSCLFFDQTLLFMVIGTVDIHFVPHSRLGSVNSFSQIHFQSNSREELTNYEIRLVGAEIVQMLHVHIFLVAPLRASNMTKAGTHQHQSRIAIRECPDNSGSATNFPI